MDIEAPHRFFGRSRQALDSICYALDKVALARIATAYFEPSGYQALQDVLAGKQVHLLVGREEGGRDRAQEVIAEFVDHLASRPLERRMRAMRQMLQALEKGLLLVAVGDSPEGRASQMDARYLYHHAKLYIADETAAVVTSANLSHHGLVSSREAGYTVTAPVDVHYFVERFDYYFAQAESITAPLIEQLLAYVEAYPPFDIYIRALIALYGLPEDEVPAQLPELAGYQRPVVSGTLQALNDYHGAMLIASTGLGKTVMAAHIVAYLRMKNVLDKVIIVCPAGLRETWRRFMRAAVTSSAEFSYNTLSTEDPARDGNLRNLEYDLRHITPQTLIILDESHHMRNADDQAGERRLRYQRIEQAVQAQDAQLLMLTATPFSRGVEDVNAQLRLLPHSVLASHKQLLKEATSWGIDTAAELPELPPCVVLTTPSVVSQFSHRDQRGERYVVFSGNQRRYFPRRLKIRTVQYANPLDNLLVELLNRRLLDRRNKQKQDQTQMQLFNDLEVNLGQKAGFFNAEVMRQFCSSPMQVESLFVKLRKSGGFNKMRFARQKELTQFVKEHLPEVQHCQQPDQDPKLHRILDIVRNAVQEKVVIFCHYIETARTLARAISEHLPGIRAETTADKDIDTVSNLLRVFAPIANDVPEEDRNGEAIHVLVATGALAEGFNLQDASIVINYDLPWTVLVLAQRMGRVLRPWHEPREITIYNFIPSTMSDRRLLMALDWQRRLVERNRAHRSFADIPVLLEGIQQPGEDGLEMVALAGQLQALNQDIALDLDETLRFIENAESLQTSSFLTDLSLLTEADRLRVAELPPGARTARIGNGKPQLFVLFSYHRQRYAALFDHRGKLLFDNDQRDHIMNTIRCQRDEAIAPPSHFLEDDAFDTWLDSARAGWAKGRKANVDEVDIVCAMALV